MKKHSFKKVLALLIAIIMVIPAIPVVASATTYTYETPAIPDDWNMATFLESVKDAERSTENQPVYVIDSREDLMGFMFCGAATSNAATDTHGRTMDNYVRMCNVVNNVVYPWIWELEQDIDWNKGTATADGFVPDASQNNVIYTWTPYWQDATAANYTGFRGIFNGNGHTINGIVMVDETTAANADSRLGFFSRVGDGAKITNVNFDNMYVYGSGRDVSGLIGTTRATATITIDGVGISGHIAGNSCDVSGFVGRPDNDATGKIIISNSSISGTVTATAQTVGGFMSSNRMMTLEISDSVCLATVTGTKYVGGFVGSAMTSVSLTDCRFFGDVNTSVPTNNPYSGAFVVCSSIRWVTCVDASSDEKPSAHYTISLTDCYTIYRTTTDYAVGVNNKTNWYDVTVKNGSADATTYDCTTATENNSAKEMAEAASKSVKKAYRVEGTSEVVSVTGVQMGTDNNARFVSTVTSQDVKAIGFSVIKGDTYMNKVLYMGTGAARLKENQKTVYCPEVYTSLKANFGADKLVANEGEYYAALAICEIDAESAPETVMVRAYTVTETDGVEEVQYSDFMAVTFYQGRVLGCVTLG